MWVASRGVSWFAVDGPEQAEEMFWRLASDPPRQWALEFGHSDRTVTDPRDLDDGDVAWSLRAEVNLLVGRAVLQWLPDDMIGIEPGVPACHVPVEIWEEAPPTPAIVRPADQARVTPGTACRAVVEYVTTGKRPTCVEWVAG